jgi:hypothetical protein
MGADVDQAIINGFPPRGFPGPDRREERGQHHARRLLYGEMIPVTRAMTAVMVVGVDNRARRVNRSMPVAARTSTRMVRHRPS